MPFPQGVSHNLGDAAFSVIHGGDSISTVSDGENKFLFSGETSSNGEEERLNHFISPSGSDVLKNKRNSNIDNKDIDFVIDNAINSEVRCSNLSTRHLDEIKKKLERMAIQSLSSSMVKEAESVE